jgi:hypothetical protein
MRVKNAWQGVFHFIFVLVASVGWVVPWITPRYDGFRPVHVSYSRVPQQERGGGDVYVEERGLEEESLRGFD